MNLAIKVVPVDYMFYLLLLIIQNADHSYLSIVLTYLCAGHPSIYTSDFSAFCFPEWFSRSSLRETISHHSIHSTYANVLSLAHIKVHSVEYAPCSLCFDSSSCYRLHIMCWHTMYGMICYDVISLVATCLLQRIREFIHQRPKAKCGIAVLGDDKFQYPR